MNKLCGRCYEIYKGKEYTMTCPKCAREMGTLATIRSYERLQFQQDAGFRVRAISLEYGRRTNGDTSEK